MSAAEQPRDYALRPVIFALVTIIILGAGLRLYRLADESLWYDEGASLYLARFATLDGALFDQTKTTEAPVMAVVARVWGSVIRAVTDFPVISPANDFMIRLWSCGWSVIAIPIIFLVGRRLLRDEYAALLAALLFAVSPYHIYYAQEFRIYSFFTVVGLVALYFMLRALEENRWPYWLLMALGFAFMMYCHFVATFYIFAFNAAFVLMLPRFRRHFWRWTAWNALAMVLLAPALYLALHMNRMIGEITIPWFPAPTPQTMVITFKTWFAAYGLVPKAYWPLLLLALGLFGAGLFRLRRNLPALAAILSLTFLPMILGAIKWNIEDFSFYEHRIFTLSGAMVLFGVAAGLRAVPTAWGPRVGTAALLLLTVPCLAAYYRHDLHPVNEHRYGVYARVDQRSAAAYIAANLAPGDVVAHASHFTQYALYHYLPEATHVRLGYSEQDRDIFIQTMGNPALSERHGLMPVPIWEALAGARRVWFLDAEGITFEWEPTTEGLLHWLQTHWRRSEIQQFHGLKLYLFEEETVSAKNASGTL